MEGIKNRRIAPSRWLQTDRVILSTVRWSGAYLCGMGELWSVYSADSHGDRRSDEEYGEILEAFFSRVMKDARGILQRVEWVMNLENRGHEFFSIQRDEHFEQLELCGEMSAAYGNRETSYRVSDTSAVDVYSFEFDSLAVSYPTAGKEIRRISNRERIGSDAINLYRNKLQLKIKILNCN